MMIFLPAIQVLPRLCAEKEFDFCKPAMADIPCIIMQKIIIPDDSAALNCIHAVITAVQPEYCSAFPLT